MKISNLFTDDRAVSPVVGVALLIAIAVILAAVIGAVVLGLGTGGVDTPQAQLQGDFEHDETAELSHNGGEPLDGDEVYLVNGDEEWHFDGELTAGSTLDIGDFVDADGDAHTLDQLDHTEDMVVLWEDPNSDSETVIERFDVEE